MYVCSPEDILSEFFDLRLDLYGKRKAYMVAEIKRQLSVLANKVRFILEVVNGTLIVSNRKSSVRSPVVYLLRDDAPREICV